MSARKKPFEESYIPIPQDPDFRDRKLKIWNEAVKRMQGGFIRVRAVRGAGHVYDIPVALHEAHPDRYVVVDPDVVGRVRPAVVAEASASEVNDAREGDSEEETNE